MFGDFVTIQVRFTAKKLSNIGAKSQSHNE